jgi:hypothetical protein
MTKKQISDLVRLQKAIHSLDAETCHKLETNCNDPCSVHCMVKAIDLLITSKAVIKLVAEPVNPSRCQQEPRPGFGTHAEDWLVAVDKDGKYVRPSNAARRQVPLTTETKFSPITTG